MKILITGWFSRKSKGTTLGDLLSIEVLENWLIDWGLDYDIADSTGTCDNAVDWTEVSPSDYSIIIYLTGPMISGSLFQRELTERFKPNAKVVGLNVSLIEIGSRIWNPFDAVFARDTPTEARADLVFLEKSVSRKLVGVALRGEQSEYVNKRVYNSEVQQWFSTLIEDENYAGVYFDTDVGNMGIQLSKDRDLAALISKCDLILTTRLHAAVLAIRNHVPVVAVDQIEDGAKLSRVLESVKWPHCYIANRSSYNEVKGAANSILSYSSREAINHSNATATAQLKALKADLKNYLNSLGGTANT